MLSLPRQDPIGSADAAATANGSRSTKARYESGIKKRESG